MSAYLYVNSSGYPVHTNSYSGGALFQECGRKYEYSRKLGYKEKIVNAAMEFGNAWEAALAAYHGSQFDLTTALNTWERAWAKCRAMDLRYKDSESWDEMYHQGAELLRLYALRLPSLPIGRHVRFQLNYRTELFPDTEYAGLQDQSFIDMLVEDADPKHVLLPPAATPSETRQLVVDIKTSGKRYPQDARLLRLDPQLRRYSWHTGIETVAFLVGVRNNRKLDRGDAVTLLADTPQSEWKAGETVVVFAAGEHDTYALTTPADYEQYLLDQKGVRGKALETLKQSFTGEHCISLIRGSITNQEIQFLATVITQQEREEAGTQAGHEALGIYEAEQHQFYPQRPGIRFPNNHCTYCPYLGLCIGDQNLVDAKLVNISGVTKKAEPDWLDEMLEDAA